MPKLGSAPVFQAAPASAGIQLSLKIVTPVLGGGVEAGINDPLSPIRPAAVRGMLRWWWRATAGAKCQSGPELYKKESTIWGSTDCKSPVSVEIHNPFLSPGVDAVRDDGGRKVFEQPGYALFPAQQEIVRKFHKTGSFDLVVTCPKHFLLEIENAVRAWVFFGGVGSRTRRGLGSLLAVSDPKFKLSMFAAFIQTLPPSASPDWSTLGQSSFILHKKSTPVQAWNDAVKLYKNFRQDRRPGQTPNRPGRSYWEEPDAIRRLRGTADRRHSEPVTEENVFPRAQMGLPIIFHFKDSRTGDPQDNTLEIAEEGSDRMASPVITKAIAASETEGFPLILALRGPEAPRNLVLKQARDKDIHVTQGGIDAIEDLFKKAERVWAPAKRGLLK